MYNCNYGGFDYVRIHSKLRASVLNRKTVTLNPGMSFEIVKSRKRIKLILSFI